MDFLITGANGLLGQKLCDLLIDRNKSFIATSKGANRNPALPEELFRPLDITNKKEVEEILSTLNPTAVINTAGMTNVDQCESDRDDCWNLNVRAVQYLVDACEQSNCKLVHLSTDFIFDGTAGPYSEDATPNPVSHYGESKLAGEQVVIQSNIDWVIARTILVYGLTHNMSRSNIILWVKDSLSQGKNLKIVDDQWRTPTLAEDLAEGCLLAAEKGAGIYNISGKDLMTPYDMALATVDAFELDGALIERADSSTFSQAAKRPPKTGLIIDKARKQLGYEPRSFEQGLTILKSQLNELA